MGELGIGVTDLHWCPSCGHGVAMIFQSEKLDWWVACGYRTCGYRTKEHPELLDACSEWGLKPNE